MKPGHIVGLVIAVVCTALPLAAQFYGDRHGGWLMVDFRAYYCAASAVGHNANPYFVSAVHACESAPSPPYYQAPAHVTVPAPYPPYALMMIYPLTLLPFGVATIVWWVILATALGFAAWALARVTRQPFLVAWAVFALSLGLTTLTSGNIIPVCVAALMVAALCAQQGHLQGTAFAITLAMIEPQLALPAAIAAFVRFPAIRLTLALLFALLGVGSLAVSGLARTIGYVTAVLPAHALSEVSRDNQYSLSTVMTALGVADAQAVVIGSVSYAIVMVVGIYIAVRLARDYHDPAFALFVPPAFALLGGSFVHTGEIAIATPACLLFFARAKSHRELLLAILVLLAVPWMLATSAASLLAPIFPVAYLVYALSGYNRTQALAAALASMVVLGSLFVLALHPSPHLGAHTAIRPPIDPRLAEASWRSFVLGNSSNRLITWLLRLPTWLGLIGLALAGLWLCRRSVAPVPLATRAARP